MVRDPIAFTGEGGYSCETCIGPIDQEPGERMLLGILILQMFDILKLIFADDAKIYRKVNTQEI